MSGYDTHHAALAQQSGTEAWTSLIVVGAVGVCIVVVYLVVIGVLESRARRYDRDHDRHQMHADRRDPGEHIGDRVKRLANDDEQFFADETKGWWTE